MRIYQVILLLLTPFIWLKLFNFCQHRNYKLIQAFGIHKENISVDLWIHCASVGEVVAMNGFINEWQKKYPQQSLLITTMTPTGAAQVKKRFGSSVQHRYLPIDWKGSVQRFLKTVRCPKLLIVETELWPNLLQKAKAKGMQIHIVNARMSKRSFNKYVKYPNFSRCIMNYPDRFYAHNEIDAERFKALGAESVVVIGNVKFDIQVDESVLNSDWRSQLGQNRMVWVAASTHEGEDEILLRQHKMLQTEYPDALLIIVPRHPERFQTVYRMASQRFKKVGKRSKTPTAKWNELNVLVGDSMGEMMYYFQASDIAFVAGSLIKRGGHNPIEPALLAKPILVGEHTFNFAEITEGIIQAGGGIRCKYSEVISKLLIAYADDRDTITETGNAAQEFVMQNQGAVQKLLHHIESFEKN